MSFLPQQGVEDVSAVEYGDRHIRCNALSVGYVLNERRDAKLSAERRRALEAMRERAEKEESLSLLAGGVAHDLNNLLVGVIGNTGLVRETVTRGSLADECLDDITDAALAYLTKPSVRPFFGFVHYFDPHAPYVPRGDVDPNSPQRALYESEVRYADAALGRAYSRSAFPSTVSTRVSKPSLAKIPENSERRSASSLTVPFA